MTVAMRLTLGVIVFSSIAGYTAGLRVSEACGLRWRNLQARGDAGQILVHGKGGRTRVVYSEKALDYF